jgi:nucleotide-binding universal stress UspA family protein
MYRRILVPVDGSKAAALGLREAIRLAKGRPAKIRLVHVLDESGIIGAVESGADTRAFMRALARSGRAVLETSQQSAKKLGVEAETALRKSLAGRAAEEILAEAKKWRADLIVMGTHGRRGVSRLVLGSNAELVARLAGIPVLLVRGRGG